MIDVSMSEWKGSASSQIGLIFQRMFPEGKQAELNSRVCESSATLRYGIPLPLTRIHDREQRHVWSQFKRQVHQILR